MAFSHDPVPTGLGRPQDARHCGRGELELRTSAKLLVATIAPGLLADRVALTTKVVQ